MKIIDNGCSRISVSFCMWRLCSDQIIWLTHHIGCIFELFAENVFASIAERSLYTVINTGRNMLIINTILYARLLRATTLRSSSLPSTIVHGPSSTVNRIIVNHLLLINNHFKSVQAILWSAHNILHLFSIMFDKEFNEIVSFT